MEPLPLNEVVLATKGALDREEAGELFVRSISTDTRTLTKGDLYVPLKGDNFDGHDFLNKAVDRGAEAFLTERAAPERNGCSVPSIRVPSTQCALLHLAYHYRSKFQIPVVGVTGSNGKTTTKDLLGHVLSEAGPTVFSEKSFNNFVGLPATIFRINGETRYAVLELGTNSPGEIAQLTSVAAPEIGVITNISYSHLEGLKDLDGVMNEKASLLKGLKGRAVSVLNRDDPSYESLAAHAPGKVVTFGICHRSDYMAINIDVGFEGLRFEVDGVKMKLPLLGVHNIYNALAVIACAVQLDLAPERIASAFERFEGPPMRLKPIRKGSLLVLNDTYNANPGSMESAIKTFSVLPSKGRKVVVLGDMLELGEQSRTLHRKVGEQLSCGDFDLVVGVGAGAGDYLAGATERGIPQEKMVSFADTDKARNKLPGLLEPSDSILVKGSRRMGLDSVVKAVLATGI